MSKIDYYLREIMKTTGWKQAELASRLDTTQATVSRWFKGAEPEGHRRDAILELYSSVTNMAAPSGVDQPTVRLIGYIGAGQAVYPLDDGTDDQVEAPRDAKPTTVAAQIRGDSMLPIFQENWLIYWSTNLPPHEMINQLCVVQVSDGRLLVKTLRRGSQDGLWTLTSFNASDITDVPVDWAAPIDWIKPR
ncbi:LexA family transcriptional regulator [Brucella oryzae]|nr:LexA family transcriptional regulator [Brucella oryzae]